MVTIDHARFKLVDERIRCNEHNHHNDIDKRNKNIVVDTSCDRVDLDPNRLALHSVPQLGLDKQTNPRVEHTRLDREGVVRRRAVRSRHDAIPRSARHVDLRGSSSSTQTSVHTTRNNDCT